MIFTSEFDFLGLKNRLSMKFFVTPTYNLHSIVRSFRSSFHQNTKERICYKSVDVGGIPFGNIKQSSREKISHRCWCKTKNHDNSCDQEKQNISQATLIWRAIKLPIYSVAIVPLTVCSLNHLLLAFMDF